MTRNATLFNESLDITVEGKPELAQDLLERVGPIRDPEDCRRFLFHILGEGDLRKIDLLVNSAMVGMQRAYDALAERDEDRKVQAAVAKALMSWRMRRN